MSCELFARDSNQLVSLILWSLITFCITFFLTFQFHSQFNQFRIYKFETEIIISELRTGGGYSQYTWVKMCGPLPKSRMTIICDFPSLIYDLTKSSIIRHDP